MPATEKNANSFSMTSLSAVNSGYSLMLINNSTNEGQLVTMTDLATMILNEIRNKTFTATELGQSSASTLPAAISSLNSAISSVRSIAEKATHSINLIPFGSRSFEDTVYWRKKFLTGISNNIEYFAEQLEDGWIHIVIDPTGYTGTKAYIDDLVRVAASPSIKTDGLYTMLFEVRNNKSTITGSRSSIYIQESNGHQFWGQNIIELLEGQTNTGMYLKNANTSDGVYRHRFTQRADSGTHAGSNPETLFQMTSRVDVLDVLDYELRISIYEGRYLGDYMPYIVSDVTDLKKTATPTTDGLMSAQDKQKLDNL